MSHFIDLTGEELGRAIFDLNHFSDDARRIFLEIVASRLKELDHLRKGWRALYDAKAGALMPTLQSYPCRECANYAEYTDYQSKACDAHVPRTDGNIDDEWIMLPLRYDASLGAPDYSRGPECVICHDEIKTPHVRWDPDGEPPDDRKRAHVECTLEVVSPSCVRAK